MNNINKLVIYGLGPMAIGVALMWMFSGKKAAKTKAPEPEAKPKPEQPVDMRELARKGGQRSAEVRRAKALAKKAAKQVEAPQATV